VNFRLRVATWFALSLLILIAALLVSAHQHLDGELRKDRWDRSHPKFPEWVIHGSYTDEEVHDVLGELIQVWLWVGTPIVIASLGAGYYLAMRSVRPIRRINRELAALDLGALEEGVSVPEKDAELATLVKHINELLHRMQHSYGEMAEFSSLVAHELRTPLTLLRLKIEATASLLPPEISEELQEDLHRLSRLVERSLLTAKAETKKLHPACEPVELSLLLEDLRESYSLMAAEQGIEMEWSVARAVWCRTDPDLILQIFHNLLGNALRYGEQRARVSLSQSSGRATVRISNLFSFQRPARPGTGLGLRLVRSLCASMEQTRFRCRESRGVFSVRLALRTFKP